MKKTTKQLIGVVIAVGAIVAVVAYAYGEYVGYSSGYSSVSRTTTTTTTRELAAGLTATLNASTVDHTSTVAADGAVATETDVPLTLTISNTDDDIDADDVQILLYNPRSDKEGLHSNLETDSTEIGITSGGLTAKLFHDGDYVTGGYGIGDIPAGGEVSLTFTFTLETGSAGTFQDGQSYTCYMYVYQPDAEHYNTVTFTVTT